MSKTQLTNEQSAALEEAKQLFSVWRETRTRRGRMPDDLWDVATDLFHTWELSINRVARGLRLNYSTLKTRILEKQSVAISSSDDTSATFIELDPPHVCSDCVIEMENQSGVKMRMCFRGRADPAVVNLGRYFLEGHQ